MRAIRKSDQPGAAIDTQFLTDPRGMVLDGPNRQPERCGDFLIGKALSNEPEDLHLARGQTLVLYTLQRPFGDQNRPLFRVRMDDVGCGEVILGLVEVDREDAVKRRCLWTLVGIDLCVAERLRHNPGTEPRGQVTQVESILTRFREPALQHVDAKCVSRLDRRLKVPPTLLPYRLQALGGRSTVTSSLHAMRQPPFGSRQPTMLRPYTANDILEHRWVDLPGDPMNYASQHLRQQRLRAVCSLMALIVNPMLHDMSLFCFVSFSHFTALQNDPQAG